VRRTRLCNTGEIEDIYREDCWRRFGVETISLAGSLCVCVEGAGKGSSLASEEHRC